MTVALAWEKALRVPGFAVTPEVRAAGWPDAFAVGHIACLQYPVEGTDADKSKARRNRRALCAAIGHAIEAGDLEAEQHSRTIEVRDDSDLFRPIVRSQYLTPREWYERVRPERRPARPARQKVETWYTVTRAAFRDWLARQGEEPSEHIRAWLRPLEHAEAYQEDAAPNKAKRETQADRVERWLKECERRAAERGEAFDRLNMPGTKAEFLDLLHALDAYLRSIKTVDSLDRYLSGRCSWPLDASAQPSAGPLFRRLFPEASMRTPGAVFAQRQKA